MVPTAEILDSAVSPLLVADLDAAASLLTEAIGAPDPEGRAADLVRDHRVLVARDGRVAVGALAASPTPDGWVVAAIAVAPESRGHGVGRALVDHLASTGPDAVVLAEAGRDAVGFYRRAGIQVTSLGEKYPGVERFACERGGRHDSPPADAWNHNIHFHRVALEAIPAGARSALDVGTGDGLLAADLRRVLPEVTGIDLDGPALETARRSGLDVEWIQGDVLTYDFGRRYDVVASVATLHHLPDVRAALGRLAELTSPGGVLVVIGLARATTLKDGALGAIGIVQHHLLSRRRTCWEHTAPTSWPPPHSYREVRAAARELLPGVAWRQYPLWRYSLVWRRPAGGAP